MTVANERYHVLTCVSAIFLSMLMVAWEAFLAPLQVAPGKFSVVWAVKALPLVLMIPSLLRKNLYVYQVCSMFVLLYILEGLVRALDERGLSMYLAWGQTLLATTMFVAILKYVAPFKKIARAKKKALQQANQ